MVGTHNQVTFVTEVTETIAATEGKAAEEKKSSAKFGALVLLAQPLAVDETAKYPKADELVKLTKDGVVYEGKVTDVKGQNPNPQLDIEFTDKSGKRELRSVCHKADNYPVPRIYWESLKNPFSAQPKVDLFYTDAAGVGHIEKNVPHRDSSSPAPSAHWF